MTEEFVHSHTVPPTHEEILAVLAHFNYTPHRSRAWAEGLDDETVTYIHNCRDRSNQLKKDATAKKRRAEDEAFAQKQRDASTKARKLAIEKDPDYLRRKAEAAVAYRAKKKEGAAVTFGAKKKEEALPKTRVISRMCNACNIVKDAATEFTKGRAVCKPCYNEAKRNSRRVDSGPVTHKVCPACQQDKAIDNFYVNQLRSDGHESYCKVCKSAARKK